MRKSVLVALSFFVILGFWAFWRPSRPPMEVKEITSTSQKTQVNGPTALPQKLPPRIPSSSSSKSLRDRLDPAVTLQVGSRKYQVHERLMAIEKARAQQLGLSVERTLGAWALIDVTQSPEESYPVVERVGTGELGVFRGVLKGMSREILSENGGWKSCPSTVLTARPEIKIYLFQLSGEASPEELKACLEDTRLFDRLEWEVLDQPRLSR